MRSTPTKPTLPTGIYRARDVPAKLRPGISPDALVRVHVEEILTENGLTPAEEQEILAASAEAQRGENLSPGFKDADSAIAYLRRQRSGTGG
jgi:hypothetical protein